MSTEECCKKMPNLGEPNTITNVEFNDDFLIWPAPKIF